MKPSVVKSIKQRDLLNTRLRLCARTQSLPQLAEFRPERLEDELPDLAFFIVDAAMTPPRLTIESDGTRMSSAYATPARANCSTSISDRGSPRW